MHCRVKSTQQNNTLAIFDFDGTLTYRDSLLPFLHFTSGSWRFSWGLVVKSFVLAKCILKLIPNWQAKEAVISHFIKGKTVQEVYLSGERFGLTKIPKLLRPEALNCLFWHQKQGHKTILVSASPEIYLAPWARTMAFDYVIGTQLEVRSGMFTGHLQGKNCYGQEKVERIQRVLGNLDDYCIYAYGDSQGDRELLKIATYPYFRRFLALN